ncbi:hypothetical protein ABB02_00737 [Clostridiaceae bacterium JG1575]|nr:hypothetical protein ABB02_00737 [Clostridiaceae bacterium JG1575]
MSAFSDFAPDRTESSDRLLIDKAPIRGLYSVSIPWARRLAITRGPRPLIRPFQKN